MSNTVRLEVDPSIIERNLDFRVQVPNSEYSDDPLSRLFPRNVPESDTIPWKAVFPKPGFVAKLKTEEGDKIFINVCHCLDVPTPRDISDTELIELLDSEDPSTFTVPMSIGDLHVECDKSGNLVSAYDIAINTTFYDKILNNSIFKEFFLSIIIEGVERKHKLQLDRNSGVVVLKNKKCFGSLQSHRIQQRPVRSAPVNLIEELPDRHSLNNSSSEKVSSKPLIEELPDSSTSSDITSEPRDSDLLKDVQLPVNDLDKVRLVRTPRDGPIEKLIAFISISALSGNELELDVGEDRILVNSPRKKELIDFFFPYSVDRDNVSAKYFVNTQTLRIDLPVCN